jgi:UDPglucose 6-dehydrogenase
MIKYASNAFLATKISFINEIAQICERLGADAKEVAIGMGYDKRIGRSFLDAGIGYGGSCFGKDVSALAYMADEADLHPQLLHAVMQINHDQRRLVVSKLINILGSLRNCTIGILGLAFKPNTDDMREAPAVDIIRWLTAQGATVRAYDPAAKETACEALKHKGVSLNNITFCETAYQVAEKTDAIVIVTEWEEFKSLNMQQIRQSMRRPVLIDGRNIYEPDEMNQHGFIYCGIGRPTGLADFALSSAEPTSLSPEQSAFSFLEEEIRIPALSTATMLREQYNGSQKNSMSSRFWRWSLDKW